MLIDTQFLILILLAAIGTAISLVYHRRAEAIAAKLTPEDRQTFNTRYRNRSDRANMPAKFDDLAAAADKVRGARTGVTVILGIAVLFYFL
jgi:hypothetical protein